jgi:hypothetical protein
MNNALLQRPSRVVVEDLQVERTDIDFVSTSPESVAIAITLTNPAEVRSQRTFATVAAAPFGAFVPWRPLAVLPVPSLEPGASHVLELEARRLTPAPLGRFDRLPPRHLLTALDADNSRDPQALDPLQARQPLQGAPLTLSSWLPADLFDLTNRTNPHWAGNLNIFIGGRAVERHLARALRIYPGRLNLAMFVVGCGPDAYAFALAGDGANWDTQLFDMSESSSLLPLGKREQPLALDHWITVRSQRLMMLALQPPVQCGKGTVEVQVTQRSTGQVAVVEFSLDPNAAGPGCYVV